MKYPHFIIAIALSASFLLPTKGALAENDTFEHDGSSRTYLYHLPDGYNNTPVPLVIVLHPLNANGITIQNASQFNSKADEEHFIVAYPYGHRGTWNGGSCCGFAMSNNIDDVGFIDALADTMMTRFEIDPSRIYICGFSNGGLMAYRVANELSHRFAAAAVIAGPVADTSWINPYRPIPVMHIHALDDASIPYEGDSRYISVAEVVMAWRTVNGCVADADTIFNENGGVGLHWNATDGNADVELYTLPDGNHSWPGGNFLFNEPSTIINATDTIWEFFKSHPMQYEPTDIQEFSIPSIIEVKGNFPNPFNPSTTIEFSLDQEMYVELGIYNLAGMRITTLVGDTFAPGNHQVVWDGRDNTGQAVSGGLYLFRLHSGTSSMTGKMLLLK